MHTFPFNKHTPCFSFFFFTHHRLECVKAQRMEVIPVTIFATITKENEFHVESCKQQANLLLKMSQEVENGCIAFFSRNGFCKA